MNVQVNINEKVKDVELKMKGRHIKKIMKSFSMVTDEEDVDSKKKALGYFEVLESVTQECCALTENEMDEMDADDKNKLMNEVQKKALSTIDFLKSSLK